MQSLDSGVLSFIPFIAVRFGFEQIARRNCTCTNFNSRMCFDIGNDVATQCGLPNNCARVGLQ